jgi:hypothetical protein
MAGRGFPHGATSNAGRSHTIWPVKRAAKMEGSGREGADRPGAGGGDGRVAIVHELRFTRSLMPYEVITAGRTIFSQELVPSFHAQ